MSQRVIFWFSAGAPSAVAAKLALVKYRGTHEVVVARIVIPSEHEDNERFAAECERWFDHPITNLRSDRYSDTWDVWERRRYISGPQGALCTTELKKMVRHAFQRVDDIQVFGYTLDKRDADRAKRFRAQNPEVYLETPLIDHGLMRQDCYAIVNRAGIALPAMYLLGFGNNNCVPCAKATSPTYWNRIRRHFPARFERMAELSRRLDVRMAEVGEDRVFLDELDPMLGARDEDPDIDCSLLCAIAESQIQESGGNG